MCHYACMASDRARELKAVLDRLARQAECGSDEDESRCAEAVSAFIAGGAGLLEEAAPALRRYYRSAIAEFTPKLQREYGLPEIPDSADIWEHVSFPHEECAWHPGQGATDTGRSYLSFEGEVSWEPEHGLQLVFEDGQRVCKAGPCDGHLT